MNPNEYQEWTRTTVIYKSEDEIEYLIYGLAEETGEISEKLVFDVIEGVTGRWLPTNLNEFLKEASDICWYVARLADAFSIEFQEIVDFAINFLERSNLVSKNPDGDLKTIMQTSCKLCGIQKKIIRDFDWTWQPDHQEKIRPSLNLIMMNLIRVLHKYNSNLESVLEINYRKLTDRKERKVLGGVGDER